MATVQEQARALGDPTRHEIFRAVADAGQPVAVAELTERFGLNHNAIRQHLAKLVAEALIVEATAAPTGRGRPRLVYELAPGWPRSCARARRRSRSASGSVAGAASVVARVTTRWMSWSRRWRATASSRSFAAGVTS